METRCSAKPLEVKAYRCREMSTLVIEHEVKARNPHEAAEKFSELLDQGEEVTRERAVEIFCGEEWKTFDVSGEERAIEVITKLVNRSREDGYLMHVVFKLDSLLNELLADDYFGTEGQCDPRGDQREAPKRTFTIALGESASERLADADDLKRHNAKEYQ